MIPSSIDFFSLYSVFNFLSVVVLCVYLFSRFVLPVFEEQRRLEKRNVRHLKDERVRLEKEWEIVARERDAQEQRGKWLLEKIDLWDKAVVSKERIYEEELKRSQKYLRSYLDDQASHLSLDHIKSEIAPEALLEATKELKAFFSDTKEQECFVKKVLQAMDDLS